MNPNFMRKLAVLIKNEKSAVSDVEMVLWAHWSQEDLVHLVAQQIYGVARNGKKMTRKEMETSLLPILRQFHFQESAVVEIVDILHNSVR